MIIKTFTYNVLLKLVLFMTVHDNNSNNDNNVYLLTSLFLQTFAIPSCSSAPPSIILFFANL